MLSFHKENTVILNNKCQGILKTNILASLVNNNIFLFLIFIYESYSLHGIPDSPYTSVAIFIQQQIDIHLRYLC